MRRLLRWFGAIVGMAVGTYSVVVGVGWIRYGHAAAPDEAERDPLLDRFMPSYDVVERHAIHVSAPAEVTLAAAKEQDLYDAPLVATIFRAREVILGAAPARRMPQGVLAEMLSIGWGLLAEIPDREVVVAAVTKPWEANPTFRTLPAADFAAFADADFVKIVWTLRADPDASGTSIFRTETRAIATDARARKKFRRYWAFLSPGISLIRWSLLRPLRAEAERRAHAVD